MSVGGESFESYFTPRSSPDLEAYLEAQQDIDPAAIVLLNHIPPLLGGLKSNQFIIQEREAHPDMPPDPDARVDLGRVAVSGRSLSAFSDFFERTEAQADAQYDAALFETQQLLAEVGDRGASIETLFIPDTVNSSASDYFTRLTRLAQDTGYGVVVRVVDYDDGETYQYFKRFEPIRATSATAYWEQRAREVRVLSDPLIYPGNYAAYTAEGAYRIDGPPAADALAAVKLPSIRPPFVFTSFEQVQKDYPNSPICDPTVWEAERHYYTLVGDKTEYAKVSNEHRAERDNLRQNMRRAANARTEELRQLLQEGGLLNDKLPIIRELAASADDNNAEARIILAKLGDETNAQILLREIREKTSGRYGNELLTFIPLGIHLRHDEQLFNNTAEEVKDTIAKDPGNSHQLLPFLGALYHSHDPRVGELMADYLTIPTCNVEAYARTVLHAAARWMPEYVVALGHQPPSEQRDRSLRAIEARALAFVDAHNHGKLEGVHQYMMFGPDFLLPMLFWFSNPAHRATLTQSVIRQFKAGGSVLTDSTFEQTYLLYRARYGDLPEILRHVRT